jgi:hypothetical protein
MGKTAILHIVISGSNLDVSINFFLDTVNYITGYNLW